MGHFRKNGGFWLCLILNIIFNAEWTVPAWILLGLHFWIQLSIWYFVAALALFFLYVTLVTAFLCWASSCGNIPNENKENVNPYSQKGNMYSNKDK